MRRLLSVLGLILLVTLAGCGGSTGTEGTTPTSASTPSPTATASSTPTNTTTSRSHSTTPTMSTSETTTRSPTATMSTIETPTRTRGATATATATPIATATQSPAADSPTSTATFSSTESAAGPSTDSEWTVEVTCVVDGDTMEVRFPDGEVDTPRLLGVYTPETFGQNDPAEFEGIPGSTAGRDHLANWGDQATEFATDELDGQPVRIETDPQADRRGSYGRLLVYLYKDGTDFNRQLIDRGLARTYDSSFSKRSDYTDAEAKARREDVGL